MLVMGLVVLQLLAQFLLQMALIMGLILLVTTLFGNLVTSSYGTEVKRMHGCHLTARLLPFATITSGMRETA